MTIEMNLQLNLPLGLSKPIVLLDEKTQVELIDELANLIFLFWKTVNDTDKPSEEPINE